MQKRGLIATISLIASLAAFATACGDDASGDDDDDDDVTGGASGTGGVGGTGGGTPRLGTCDLRNIVFRCIELHDASAGDLRNQEAGCDESGGVWSNAECPTEELVGCCEYTFGNQFRECFYTGTTADPVAYCTMMWDDGVWTPAN